MNESILLPKTKTPPNLISNLMRKACKKERKKADIDIPTPPHPALASQRSIRKCDVTPNEKKKKIIPFPVSIKRKRAFDRHHLPLR
jgi:hypothetical protein